MDQEILLLRDHAARCRAIAASVDAPELAAKLSEMAAGLETQAHQFERDPSAAAVWR